MAKQNRDYGIGYEFLTWALVYFFMLVLLMVWVYNKNTDFIPQV